eukprot:12871-Prymnesium_polylepis.1
MAIEEAAMPPFPLCASLYVRAVRPARLDATRLGPLLTDMPKLARGTMRARRRGNLLAALCAVRDGVLEIGVRPSPASISNQSAQNFFAPLRGAAEMSRQQFQRREGWRVCGVLNNTAVQAFVLRRTSTWRGVGDGSARAAASVLLLRCYLFGNGPSVIFFCPSSAIMRPHMRH